MRTLATTSILTAFTLIAASTANADPIKINHPDTLEPRLESPISMKVDTCTADGFLLTTTFDVQFFTEAESGRHGTFHTGNAAVALGEMWSSATKNSSSHLYRPENRESLQEIASLINEAMLRDRIPEQKYGRYGYTSVDVELKNIHCGTYTLSSLGR